jgi:hypothetical protein
MSENEESITPGFSWRGPWLVNRKITEQMSAGTVQQGFFKANSSTSRIEVAASKLSGLDQTVGHRVVLEERLEVGPRRYSRLDMSRL